ncbi:unnamed protein product [Protopolystoma xenopodis]|uniref:Uncharacterized protein n=1 Tax=Protopolystoma xenopodis TaxID=117903 RepID=A0A448WQR5_9PLAT|nr:unnamed protein product [Protopolystoma xenopodis]
MRPVEAKIIRCEKMKFEESESRTCICRDVPNLIGTLDPSPTPPNNRQYNLSTTCSLIQAKEVWARILQIMTKSLIKKDNSKLHGKLATQSRQSVSFYMAQVVLPIQVSKLNLPSQRSELTLPAEHRIGILEPQLSTRPHLVMHFFFFSFIQRHFDIIPYHSEPICN